MNILEHSARGATLHFDQRELLLAMALIQEGEEHVGCNTDAGKALDDLFTLANILVEEARRRNLKRNLERRKTHTCANLQPVSQKIASNGPNRRLSA